MTTQMIRTRMGLLVMMAAFSVFGCAKEEKLTMPNLPPQTYLAIADSVRNVTTYAQTLRWWGDDRDGEVVAYEYRWFIDPSEGSCRTDTNWVRTEATSGTFNLPVSGPDRIHHFEVRAIDNDEARDPTPCRLTLPVKNSRPQITIWNVNSLPDTTLPAFLAKVHGSDPDGDNTIAKYLAWLDNDRAHAKVITPPDTTVSLGPTDFGGRYETSRTLKVVAVDYGCDTSAVATYTWYVKQPSGRILLVDDLGDEGGRSSDSTTDAFYRGGLDLCQQDYSVLDIDKFGGMLSAFNLSKLFSMFDLVIWYNEPDTGPPKAPYVLHVPSAQQDLETYVENGGHLLMASLWAVGSSGALSDSVWPEILGIDSVVVKDNSTSFDCKHWTIQSDVPPGPDSIQVVGLWGGVDCMLPRPEAAPLYYIPPGTANTPRYTQTVPFYLGLLNSWGTGKAALLTFPLSRSDGNGNATAEYCKLVNLLLQ